MRRLVCLSFSFYCRALLLTVLLGFGAALLPGGTAAVWALTPNTPSAPNAANTPAAPEEPVPDVSQLQAQLAELPTSAATDEAMGSLVDQINAIATAAGKLGTVRAAQLADLNARLSELGEAPADGVTEDPDITRRRAALTKQRNSVDADIRLARLVVVDARQRGTELWGKHRKVVTERLVERTDSPLGGGFWRSLWDAWPADRARLKPLGDEITAGLTRAWLPEHRGPVLLTLVLTLLAVTAGVALIEHGLVRLAQKVLPGGRLRRSLLVLAIVCVNMLVVTLAVALALSSLKARGLMGAIGLEVSTAFSGMVILMSFIASLGRALLANARPTWRLPPIPDPTARRLRAFPLLTALAVFVVWVPNQLNLIAETSPAWIAATDAFGALVLTALIAAMLLSLRGPRPAAADAAQDSAAPESAPTPSAKAAADAPERPLWVALLLGAIAVALIITCLLLALGYVALANAAVGQLTWTGIVVAAFYVLFKFADDLFMALLSAKSGFGQRLQTSFGFAPSTLNQAAVVLSAIARVALFFLMLAALVEPLGTGPAQVVQRSGEFGDGIKIGEFQLVPSALFGAVGVLAFGFITLRVARHWLQERYLPTTTMEPGMRSSIVTLLGYAGAIVVVALALSALGIGINRIAWIASALSVGIGFGLQAIVQNFISGLILLAERPVKVGDWVVLGNTEGDVRRINVRATEIALGDRSTLIVPNSEFITKTVRNMTLSNAEGRVLIRLPMPLDTDAHRVRELILAACTDHPAVLKAPAPSLTLEGIENGLLIFQAVAYVPGPRQASAVRSELLFTILGELRQAGLPLSSPAMVMSAPPALAQAAQV